MIPHVHPRHLPTSSRRRNPETQVSSMPKKRFTSRYSKPHSTAHPSLNPTATTSSSAIDDAPLSVNSILSNLRKSEKPARVSPISTVQPTLPPQIRTILSQPETPLPTPRSRRPPRFDENGRRTPAGPPPPKSWLVRPQNGARREASGQKRYPRHVNHFPGLTEETRGLRDTCLRAIAQNWETVSDLERNYLVDLPTALRTALLSHVAVHGPEQGVGFPGLRSLLLRPVDDALTRDDTEVARRVENHGLCRLDLSGSIGRSISFKQLIEIIRELEPEYGDIREGNASWEDAIPIGISPILPCLTHLSLSHPPSTISWPRLLQFSTHVPTLTHLSLGYWPPPSMTPNATTAIMSSSFGSEIQYGAVNLYSHSLDNEYYESAKILRRLAARLYNLEFLDLTGCHRWFRALCWQVHQVGPDWKSQWPKLNTLVLQTGITFREDATYDEAFRSSIYGIHQAALVMRVLGELRKGRKWIDVQTDDIENFRNMWKGGDSDSQLKALTVEECIKRINQLNLTGAMKELGIQLLDSRRLDRVGLSAWTE